MLFWTWNGGLRCYATSPLARHQKPPRTSSDPLLRIERSDADNRLHARCPPLLDDGERSLEHLHHERRRDRPARGDDAGDRPPKPRARRLAGC